MNLSKIPGSQNNSITICMSVYKLALPNFMLAKAVLTDFPNFFNYLLISLKVEMCWFISLCTFFSATYLPFLAGKQNVHGSELSLVTESLKHTPVIKMPLSYIALLFNFESLSPF